MRFIIEFIKNNIFSIFSLFISLSSLFIALLNLYNNRKQLDVSIENGLDLVEDMYFNILDYKNNSPSINFGKGNICYIKTVNPSPKDIAFFDLRVIDMNTNKPIFFLTNAILELSKSTNERLFYSDGDSLVKLNIPNSNYGIFKSNSFSRFEIVFYPPPNAKEISISFKVAISSIKSNKEASYRKNFKSYKKIFTLPH